MSEDKNLEELAALLNDHQVTNEEGAIQAEAEEAPTETPAAQEEKTSDEQAPTAEKPAKSEAPSTQEAATEDEPELGVDDSGKRYVPEKRFKDVYGKAKQTERELKALKEQLAKGNALLEATGKSGKALPEPERVVDKADILELKLTKPQFNPQSADYNQELDELAGKIFKATPGISVIEAADEAERYARGIASRISTAKTEARQVKALQADQGITGNSGQRSGASVDPKTMSLEEMEAYLRENKVW